ncbi:hypothetical protein [Pseudomonas monteilii]|uniref:YbjN domain-containing protein n=1 Tax=Pseudomonas monteilii TaxID=76759 RepID=A0A2N1IM84_9PSED|nr:hypothetical protein [Pseudomonas monteilii]PKI19376.1 hypothetical protein CXB65_23085 [Pseudomonas monteilii]RPD91936.1 hypothetical protein EGN69_15880 [Pseudomonas monteilii]
MASNDVRLSSKYEGLLTKLGYEVKGVYDWMVFFEDPGKYAYSLSFDGKSGKYISVGFGINIDEANASIEHRYAVVQFINEKMKFVKLHLDEKSAQFSCDHLLFDDANLAEIIDVSKYVMQTAYDEMIKKFAELGA